MRLHPTIYRNPYNTAIGKYHANKIRDAEKCQRVFTNIKEPISGLLVLIPMDFCGDSKYSPDSGGIERL